MIRRLALLTLILCLVGAPAIAQSNAGGSQKNAGTGTGTPQVKVLAPRAADIDAATLSANGLASWRMHYGKVAGLGYFTTAGGREVVINWDEGGASRMQGGLSDQQWEVFCLAFAGTGRIMILSDKPSDWDWKFDYRFLEAQK
jgi:hypothetical protein